MGESIPNFGQFLEGLRGSMSLREAAKKCGLSHAYIRDLELEKNRSTNEKITPSPGTLKKLSGAYGYPYTELMIKAGHLMEQDVSVSSLSTIQVDLTDVLYIEIGMKEIYCLNQHSRIKKNMDSLKDFIQFLELIDKHDFKKVDTDVYASFQQIRKYDEHLGKLYFDSKGTGLSVTMSEPYQRKYHELIFPQIAKNNRTNLEFTFGNKNSLQTLLSSVD
ncbi:helix-turn-helix domain-containing protein [Paenibacillus radicis (ex Xue et al. 2023)]|uniref:Helix-turn-helix transcriptional regulator n=1 Tax=Paenibacillus radicis (ex Xue et al. 2023) TaxID=2972489 RepID=A0ABT1YCX0_9BACL|nr:helix-turn-helix transcriptional regulator [Paenibacillus radicis (ex Xue et al. 2023)]MCR8631042.1 helix-turn-helix transcriptional regulator [Paenibacillus radicis (ex Xue et al. 2023)]